MTDTDEYSEYITLLNENKNLILTGAPGTGKTYLAHKIAEAMNAECEFVQFHPSYDYTDFVEGLRPTAPDNNGNIGFERKDGVFKAFCKKALTINNNQVFTYKDIRLAKSFDDAYNLLVSAIKRHSITLYSDFRVNTVLKVTMKERIDRGREIIQFWKTNKFQDAQIDYLRKIYNHFVSRKRYDIKHEKSEQFESIIGNTIDYSYYRGIVQGLLDFTNKTSNDEIPNESIILFEQCYNELLSDIQNGFVDTVQLKTSESQKLSVTQNNSIKWQRASDDSESRNGVSLERLLKLYSKYNNVEKVETMKNIDGSIREIIGGANTTYYWAILREVLLRVEARYTQPKKFVFIIDEINRGEISKIFGELFFSIDPGYRGEKGRVKTQYQNLITDPNDPFREGFYVPDNVYIIGTMNDIDRSVESMDYAMRRRFAWKEIKANESTSMLDDLGGIKAEVVEKMNRLNNAIWDEKTNEGIDGLNSAYHIGGAYFRKLKHYLREDLSNKEEAYRQLWNNHLQGLLFEYLRGSVGAAENMKRLEDVYFANGIND